MRKIIIGQFWFCQFFAKLFDKIVHDQLSDFLLSNRILSMSQFAYRKLHSTITSLINVFRTTGMGM